MQTIRAILPPASPKFPAAATHVLIRSVSLDAPPLFFFELQIRTPGAAPEDPETVESLTAGNVSMTLSQWENWRDDMPDEEYIARKITNRLGLDLAP
jgi:hypothetical protein